MSNWWERWAERIALVLADRWLRTQQTNPDGKTSAYDLLHPIEKADQVKVDCQDSTKQQ
jgi:hypothetical protein